MKPTITIERPIYEIDAWLTSENVYRADREETKELLVKHLRLSQKMHIETNPAYAQYANQLGFDPDSLTFETLDQIPMLPSGLFKRVPDMMRSGSDDVVITTSSGTQGSVSKIPRDDITMRRFFSSVVTGIRDLINIENAETFVHNLGPMPEESNHLWISYVMAGVAMLHDTEFYIHDKKLNIERFIAALREPVTSAPVVIVGPPPVVMDMAKHLLATGPLSPSNHRYVVTIGGWKRRIGDMINRQEFQQQVLSAFGLTYPSAVRDAFNMVELNTAILECEHHRKHCPPWLYISVRDPKTLLALESGKSGILAYADPTPVSFPGTVLSDDFGHVERNVKCACGIVGDILTIERRINKIENRGCALKI
ncbi:LuxE/PaaK family acyltransferase [Leptospira santarosai]|uniref:LuxE/PaaK family acyltransferase n=1 Tax=Leptospira santarosai TaxID=28183 RepID=UPI0024AFE5A5|nr:hypothetical protein [Leptospira santarosai]MDI7174956.1 hypothetical protein [Leptospira santarosai]MDI7194542.1 hypothetical protein [Leptospira santarosai]MDO6399007.1 hypothetical protein [Leptospira santarosai]MDO6404384.1 hypothetical protein [Leptospira santarosai]